MAASTLSAIDYIVKTVYKDGGPLNLASRNHPAWSMIRKVGGFTGKQFDAPVTSGNPQGISNKFTTAQSSVSAHTGDRWAITRAKKYGYYTLDAETLHAVSDNKGAFVREVRHAMDTLLMSWVDDAAFELYGDGTGVLAQVSSIATDTITLVTADDTLKFEEGMTILAATATDGTGSATTTTVSAVDEDAGTITVASGTGIAANDYLFRSGNQSTTGGGGGAASGLAAWIPDSAPGATAFFGVDRSVHPTRLGGHRVAATAVDLDEALMDLAARIHRRKGRPDVCFVAPTNFVTLAHKLGAKVERMEGGTATIGFAYINLATPAGIVKVIPDPDCPTTNAYMIDRRVTYIKHLRALPHFVDDDGLSMVRISNEDSVEFRARGWWNLVVEAPGYCGTVTGL